MFSSSSSVSYIDKYYVKLVKLVGRNIISCCSRITIYNLFFWCIITSTGTYTMLRTPSSYFLTLFLLITLWLLMPTHAISAMLHQPAGFIFLRTLFNIIVIIRCAWYRPREAERESNIVFLSSKWMNMIMIPSSVNCEVPILHPSSHLLIIYNEILVLLLPTHVFFF